MKYLVKTHCLEWRNVGYVVEADSEKEIEEIIEYIEYLDGDVVYNDYDSTDQIDIESVEEYEN